MSSTLAGRLLVAVLALWAATAVVFLTLAWEDPRRVALLGLFAIVAGAIGTDFLQMQRIGARLRDGQADILSRHNSHAEALEALAAAVQALHVELTRRPAWAEEATVPMRLVDLGQVVGDAVATVRATATVQAANDERVASLLERRIKREIQTKELPEGS